LRTQHSLLHSGPAGKLLLPAGSRALHTRARAAKCSSGEETVQRATHHQVGCDQRSGKIAGCNETQRMCRDEEEKSAPRVHGHDALLLGDGHQLLDAGIRPLITAQAHLRRVALHELTSCAAPSHEGRGRRQSIWLTSALKCMCQLNLWSIKIWSCTATAAF